jgi:peptide/nickel transport system permease protein
MSLAQPADLAPVKKALMKEERKLAVRRFMRNRLAVYGLCIVMFLLLLAVLAPVIAPEGPYAMDVSGRLAAPSGAHLLGTDTFGRDLLARVVYGAVISLEIGASVAALSFVFGMIIGLYASYYRFLDNILMRICDGVSAIPAILLAIAFMAVLGPSPRNVILSLSMVYIPTVARIVRSKALAVKELTYIEALRCLGASSSRIIWGHMAPNVLSPVIVQTSFIFAKAIITEAALSFLGVGVPVPTPSWGNILMEGKPVIYKAWWMIVFPGGITALSVLGLNMLGDGLRDAMDEKAG